MLWSKDVKACDEPVSSRRHTILSFAMFLVFAASLVSAGPSNADEKLVIATSKSGWLIWIAESRGLFEKHDVNASIELVESGVVAGEGLVGGLYDVATMSEFALVSRSFDHPDLRVFGTVAAIYNLRLVGRRDRGLSKLTDLPGKTIGLRTGSIAEFFLGKVIDLHGLNLQSVIIKDINVSDLPAALADGSVDGIVSWEPYATEARNRAGADALFAGIQSQQPYYFTLAARAETLDCRKVSVEAFLRALIEALAWSAENQEDAKRILVQRLELDPDSIDRLWTDHVMDVGVSQDMLFLMEQEAQWRIDRKLSSGDIPNYLQILAPQPLRHVAPHLVSIID